MIKFIEKEVYEAIGYDDGGPANAGSFRIGYFKHHDDAVKAAKGKGSWGGDGTVKKVGEVSIKIYESFQEYLDSVADSKLKDILAKLSEEEYKILQRHFR